MLCGIAGVALGDGVPSGVALTKSGRVSAWPDFDTLRCNHRQSCITDKRWGILARKPSDLFGWLAERADHLLKGVSTVPMGSLREPFDHVNAVRSL